MKLKRMPPPPTTVQTNLQHKITSHQLWILIELRWVILLPWKTQLKCICQSSVQLCLLHTCECNYLSVLINHCMAIYWYLLLCYNVQSWYNPLYLMCQWKIRKFSFTLLLKLGHYLMDLFEYRQSRTSLWKNRVLSGSL